MTQMTIEQAAEFLRSHDNFLILNHIRPDGDAVGCAAGLCRMLRAMGKTAAVWKNPQTTERFFPYLVGLETETEPEPENACIVSVDTATEGMLPLNGKHFAGRVELCIDHHPSNSFYAEATLVQPESAACGEIILALGQALGVPVSREIAEALYVAISTDTGCFQYSNVTAATLRAAADLKEAGADTYAINRAMFGTKSIARLRMESLLTDHAEFYAGGLVCLCTLTYAQMDAIGATEDDATDISSFPRDIEGVELGVMVRDLREGGSKVSLRTAGGHNATNICAQLGGGGHAAAAGASISGTVEEAKALILQAIADSGVTL